MISGKSGLFYKLGDYAVIRDGNRDGRKMNYQKHFVLLLLGGCLVAVAGEPPGERQPPPPVAEEAVIFVADHTGEQREASGGRIVPQKAGVPPCGSSGCCALPAKEFSRLPGKVLQLLFAGRCVNFPLMESISGACCKTGSWDGRPR